MLAGFFVLLAFFSSCSSDEEMDYPVQDELEGSWARLIHDTDTLFWAEMRFDKDNRFDFVILDSIPGHENTSGTYSITENQISLTDESCTGSGVYELDFSLPLMEVSLISDQCANRANVLPGMWTKVSEMPFVLGNWKRKIKIGDEYFFAYLTIMIDMSWSVIVKGNPAISVTEISGACLMGTNYITFNDNYCSRGGEYYVEMADNYSLQLKVAQEECSAREFLLKGNWFRIGY